MAARFEIISHGIDSPSYFQGCGTSFTPFSHVVTGIGDSAKSAYEDAVEQIYTMHDSKVVEALRLPRNPRGIRKSDSIAQESMGEAWDDCEDWPQFYVSIRYTIAE